MTRQTKTLLKTLAILVFGALLSAFGVVVVAVSPASAFPVTTLLAGFLLSALGLLVCVLAAFIAEG